MDLAWRDRLAALLRAGGRRFQGEIAAAAGMDPGQFSRLKRQKAPSVETLFRVARAARVSPAWLAFGEGPDPLAFGELADSLEQLDRVRDRLRAAQSRLTADRTAPAMPPEAAPAAGRTPAAQPPAAGPTREASAAQESAPVIETPPPGPQVVTPPRPLIDRSAEYPKFDPDDWVLPEPLRVAAGGARVLDMGVAVERMLRSETSETFPIRVVGDSMANTIKPGEAVLVRSFGRRVELPAIDADYPRMGVSEFRSVIREQGIYVVSVGQGDDLAEYTLKRVAVWDRSEKNWKLWLVAENPYSGWGQWGQYLVTRSERVHFLAEVIALPERRRRAPRRRKAGP